jgi:hypothetical protein
MRGQRGTEQAHRVAYEVGVGTIPTGLQVLHSCDNPSCCNPAHLFIGTNGDNHADKLRKGRQSRGERTGTARLTAEAVRHIRSRFGRDSDGTIARSYSVTPETIRKVRLGLNWRHVK